MIINLVLKVLLELQSGKFEKDPGHRFVCSEVRANELM